MFNLHAHDEYSTFDGYGKAYELAELAKEYGYNSLSTTNHGNTNGLIQTYNACKEVGIKAILGVEGYFLPKYKPQTRGYHLILIAKNLKGYGNLNRIQYEGEKQKYYNPIWDFKILEKYHEGLICTSACVAGYLAQCIINGKEQNAVKYLLKMQEIFGDDFYVEIQPYKITDVGVQEKVNRRSWELANKLGIKCILTSDSHRGRKDELETYLKMHEIAGHDLKVIEETYAERYMPRPDEMQKRFYKMHKKDFNNELDCRKFIKQMEYNIDVIENKCERDYLDALELKLPKLCDNSDKILMNKIKQGLKDRGKCNKEYIDRAKEEYEVIKYHGFSDYFLIVSDYTNWAKEQGIVVGPGRGSVCNSIVAYALKITEVDSILFGLDFRRFLRKDKKSYPDIDLDFETSRRGEVIKYLIDKYGGHSARICSYGLYKIDNLINDLAKVCGLPTDKEIDDEQIKINKQKIKEIKSHINLFIGDDGKLRKGEFLADTLTQRYNADYDNIMLHFSKLYLKVRNISTHASGVAITDGNILDYTALRIDKDGEIFTNYDLSDLENINIIKFDMLGLKTMESIGQLRKVTGDTVDYDTIVEDKKIIGEFAEGNCDGIFQFETKTPRDILKKIHCDGFLDIVASSSMNRPGPLSLKMPEAYAENKANIEEAKQSAYYAYTADSYGTIIYQEQLQQICVYIARMEWSDADKMLKLMKHGRDHALVLLEENKKNGNDLKKKFYDGCKKYGLSKSETENLFENMLVYSFVKGHGTGYSLISMEEMYYKVYYPCEYWYSKLAYARNEAEFAKFCEKAVHDGAVIFLPHVNYSASRTRLRKVEGDTCLQQGLSDLKNVGEKASEFILEERKKNGVFASFDNFYDRCKNRVVTSRVVDILKEQGALEFDKKIYLNRVTKYNSALYSRGIK